MRYQNTARALKLVILSLFLGMLCSGALLAADDSVSTMDLIREFAALVWNFRTLGLLGILSAGIGLVMKILKHAWIDAKFDKLDPKKKSLGRKIKQLLLVVLGVIAGIITSIVGGVPILEAIMVGLIASGGASAIYGAVKAFFPGPAPKPQIPG